MKRLAEEDRFLPWFFPLNSSISLSFLENPMPTTFFSAILDCPQCLRDALFSMMQ